MDTAPATAYDELLAPLQALLDRGVADSSDATRLCRRLDGRSLRFDLEGLPTSLLLTADDDRLVLGLVATGHASDCSIGGLPLSLLRLALTGDRQGLQAGTMRIAGDPAVARDFQQLLAWARPDWEEELSRVLGDVVAHQLGRLARGAIGWGRDAADTLARDLGEFLKEESRDLPTRFEVEEFLDHVDRLNADFGRAEARIERLEARLRGARR